MIPITQNCPGAAHASFGSGMAVADTYIAKARTTAMVDLKNCIAEKFVRIVAGRMLGAKVGKYDDTFSYTDKYVAYTRARFLDVRPLANVSFE